MWNDRSVSGGSMLSFLRDVKVELERANGLFPTNEFLMTAFFEEAGEVAKAFIDHARGEETRENVYKECVQAAAMAMGLAIYGSEEFSYPNNPKIVEVGDVVSPPTSFTEKEGEAAIEKIYRHPHPDGAFTQEQSEN